jgi:UDP-glucose 4-epimerase
MSPKAVTPDPVTLQDIVDVVQAAVRKAKEGDMYAAEVVRRFWKSRRETLVLDIGETRTAAEIADAQGKVLTLTFAGEITPREGRDVSTMLEYRRRALHTLDQQRELDEMVEFAKQQQADAKTKGRR